MLTSVEVNGMPMLMHLKQAKICIYCVFLLWNEMTMMKSNTGITGGKTSTTLCPLSLNWAPVLWNGLPGKTDAWIVFHVIQRSRVEPRKTKTSSLKPHVERWRWQNAIERQENNNIPTLQKGVTHTHTPLPWMFSEDSSSLKPTWYHIIMIYEGPSGLSQCGRKHFQRFCQIILDRVHLSLLFEPGCCPGN